MTVTTVVVSENYFEVLGTRPLMGRPLRTGDGVPGDGGFGRDRRARRVLR